MFANTYLYTSLLEISQEQDPSIFLKHNLFIVYKIIIQCVYQSSLRRNHQMNEKRLAAFNQSSNDPKNQEASNVPDYVYACVLMEKGKVIELEQQKKMHKNDAMFILPGLLSANVKLKKALE